jgi:hypothetical protein
MNYSTRYIGLNIPMRLTYIMRAIIKLAPAGGATAAAREWGALEGPSALTATSSWWALIILYPCKARHGRLGARRGEIRRLRSADHLQSGSLSSKGLNKYYQYTSVKISRSASPILPFEAGYSSDTLLSTFGTYV